MNEKTVIWANWSFFLDKDECDKDPRDVTGNTFNRFDPKYVSIGPKNLRNNLSTNPNKCATLKHGGRFGGSLSPNPRNIAQPVVQPPPQHFQLQQHHLQKPNNQQLEIQTYQLQQQSYQQQAAQLHQQHLEQQQNYNVATVSRDFNQHYPSATLPYKKPGTGFIETSSILKKHREEVHEMTKPNTSVFSIETSSHRQTESRSSKPISIINQPLPEIPKQQSSNPQVLSAANLSNYRSLQRPQASSKTSFPSGTMQRSRETRPVIPMKVSAPPILPPKNRQQSRNQQPMPNTQKSSGQSYNQQYPSKSYERERARDRERSMGRSYDDGSHHRSSSKQTQQQQNFQTLPHHHHHPATSSFATQTTSSKSNRKSDSSKSLHRSSREMSHPRFENYSATEL